MFPNEGLTTGACGTCGRGACGDGATGACGLGCGTNPGIIMFLRYEEAPGAGEVEFPTVSFSPGYIKLAFPDLYPEISEALTPSCFAISETLSPDLTVYSDMMFCCYL